jgi:hypothetical protein
MIYKFICFSLADTQNSEFKGDPRHTAEISWVSETASIAPKLNDMSRNKTRDEVINALDRTGKWGATKTIPQGC